MAHIVHEGEIVDSHALIRVDAIVKPAVSPELALQAWEDYQLLKQRIAKPEDFQRIQGKDFPKKSLWRKLATFFNLTMEVTSEKEIKNEDGSIDFDVVYKAVAPNGRSTTGDGSCNSHEKKDRRGESIVNSRHNTRGTAHTRAFNRAVSNLIGGGEVSAEEIEVENYRAEPAPAATRVDYPDDQYVINLGTQKSGKPHWLNGKSLEEAYLAVDRATNTSQLRATYDYLKNHAYRNNLISEFLDQAEAFMKIKNAES